MREVEEAPRHPRALPVRGSRGSEARALVLKRIGGEEQGRGLDVAMDHADRVRSFDRRDQIQRESIARTRGSLRFFAASALMLGPATCSIAFRNLFSKAGEPLPVPSAGASRLM